MRLEKAKAKLKNLTNQKNRQGMNLNKTVASLSAAVFVLVIFLSFSSATVKAETGWSIETFNSNFYLNEAADGSMNIEESIDVYFNTSKHGIFRDIPTYYDRGSFQPGVNLNVQVSSVVNGINGEAHIYQESKVNDYLRLQIGNPAVTVVGSVNYSIDYTVENAIRFFDNHDELYWDVNGTDWPVPADAVRATVHVPEQMRASVTGVKCYTGRFGSTASDCEISYDETTGLVEVESTEPLLSYENLSLVVDFEKGIFTPPTFMEKWGGFMARNIGILLPFLALFISYKYWVKHGKDPKDRGVVVPQYTPPDDLTAAELGTIADYTADDRDISAVIIDLAIRGYMRIEDITKREKTKKRKYIFHLLRVDVADLKEFERVLLNGLFADFTVGASVKMDSLKNKFYATTAKIKADLYNSLVAKEYFAAHPETTKHLMLGLGGGMVFVGFFSLGPTEARFLGWSLGMVLSGLVVALVGWFMPKRTVKGVEAKAWAEGMKMYMELAEKDRLKVMQGADSRYIGDTASPAFTVELFEKLLPYAIVMKVEKSWASQFKDIYEQPPDWYQGNWKTFNTVYLVNSLSNGVNSMSTTLTSKPSSSSGSGSSGGFSGGGFGGGGGGSW